MSPLASLFAALAMLAAPAAWAADACDAPPITTGYGADGTFAFDVRAVANPADPAQPVQVFLPRGARGPRPVIFFAHGFGPGEWRNYEDLVRHLASRGYVVVFSSYEMFGVSMQQRYEALRQGDRAAAAAFGTAMDLSRVGFVGHSFGGGAVPALAYDGVARQGWGANGAFMFELAPWYAMQADDRQIRALPPYVIEVAEVFDQDTVNDHRMAIDLFRTSAASRKAYFLVRSSGAGCGVVADHSTPGRNASHIQRQYAVFRPLDALAGAAFDASPQALAALQHMGDANGGYQPLDLQASPAPERPESAYRFGWSGPQNPRRTP
ncbi:chlorophyllase/cutinase-like alpha/beta fold protein [Caulobacter sp. KR2-114]|uniref:poly(ethylene terephthalate) hydrolase family protein n=1 Tax=Caulobacter sp. KR2-114 TaxID=3400912 RepID=UPI003C046886